MLVISRKENEAFRIEPAPGVDDSLTLREAFSRGPIVVKLVRVGGTRVRIAIASPPELKIRRESAQRAAEHELPGSADSTEPDSTEPDSTEPDSGEPDAG